MSPLCITVECFHPTSFPTCLERHILAECPGLNIIPNHTQIEFLPHSIKSPGNRIWPHRKNINCSLTRWQIFGIQLRVCLNKLISSITLACSLFIIIPCHLPIKSRSTHFVLWAWFESIGASLT